jgi:hypothetical protein
MIFEQILALKQYASLAYQSTIVGTTGTNSGLRVRRLAAIGSAQARIVNNQHAKRVYSIGLSSKESHDGKRWCNPFSRLMPQSSPAQDPERSIAGDERRQNDRLPSS